MTIGTGYSPRSSGLPHAPCLINSVKTVVYLAVLALDWTAQGAPNVVVVLIDDIGFGASEYLWRTDQHAEFGKDRRDRTQIKEITTCETTKVAVTVTFDSYGRRHFGAKILGNLQL